MKLVVRWKSPRKWLAVGAIALIVPLAVSGIFFGYRWVRRFMFPPTLGLQVKRDSGEFLVSWDRKAPEILRAYRGVLSVRDGTYQDYLDLNSLQLQTGSLAYISAGTDIEFRLDVYRDRGPNRSLSQSIRITAPNDTGGGLGTGKTTTQAGAKTRTTGNAASASRPGAVPASSVPPEVVAKSSPANPKTPPGPIRMRAQRVAQPPVPADSYLGPQVIQQVEPVIPAEVRASLAAATQIDVRVQIDANGNVVSAEVTAGGEAGSSLVSAALKAARQFRFRAARLNDRSVPSAMILSFRFVR